ncbi:MAG: type II 3-dehydroquinate dehydratase, partial [Candidatus Muiribacteriota bacterium]
REEFRHKSLLTPVVDGVVMGMKHISYLVAVDALKHKLS